MRHVLYAKQVPDMTLPSEIAIAVIYIRFQTALVCNRWSAKQPRIVSQSQRVNRNFGQE